jgi:heme/copper-type cytochrome/quinol oxidase subunit 2
LNSSNGSTELVLVLAVMSGLFIMGIVAVVIFYRVWRKERGGARKGKD